MANGIPSGVCLRHIVFTAETLDRMECIQYTNFVPSPFHWGTVGKRKRFLCSETNDLTIVLE